MFHHQHVRDPYEEGFPPGPFVVTSGGAALGAMQAVGFDPVGMVSSTVWRRTFKDVVPGDVCQPGPLRQAGPRHVFAWEEHLRERHTRLAGELRAGAQRQHADGVVDVVTGANDVVTGTSVRSRKPHRTPPLPFTCDLSAVEVAALLRSGWVPVSYVVGVAVLFWHDDDDTRHLVRHRPFHAEAPPGEVHGWSTLMQTATAAARGDLTTAMRRVDAEQAVLRETQITVTPVHGSHNHVDHMVTAVLVGTAISQFAAERPPVVPVLRLRPPVPTLTPEHP